MTTARQWAKRIALAGLAVFMLIPGSFIVVGYAVYQWVTRLLGE